MHQLIRNTSKAPRLIRRVIVLLIAAIMTAVLLAACGEETFICNHCLEEKYEVPHHALVKGTKFPSGIDMTLCQDCYDSYQRGEWELP